VDFTQLLKVMVDRGASDLFVTAGAAPSIKVDGTIRPLTKETLKPSQTRALVYSTMNDKQLAEFEGTNECNFAISAPGIGRFRVSAFMQRNTPGMVLRAINNHIPTMEELKLPDVLRELSMTKRGLILFVGGTSTGKSTSLASMIDYRNENHAGHIITIEDPIEYIHNHKKSIVTQREVGLDTDSYEIALKNTLRQAPDVILMQGAPCRDRGDDKLAADPGSYPQGSGARDQGCDQEVHQPGYAHLRPGIVRAVPRWCHHLRSGIGSRRLGQRPASDDQAG